MRKNIFFIFIACSAMISGCSKKPGAMIESNITTAGTGEEIQFTNHTTDAHSFLWNFGDGKESTEESPLKSYENAGVYSVSMTAFSKNEKKSDEAFVTITVVNSNERYIGTYEGKTCMNDDPMSIEVFEGSGPSEVMIEFGDYKIFAKVYGNKIVVPKQTVESTEFSGNGSLDNNYIVLNMYINMFGMLMPCQITGNKIV